MSLINQIKLMDFEPKQTLVIDIPGARLNLKNPDSAPKDLNGSLIYVAPNMLKNITNVQFERRYDFGTIFDLLHCSWPCWPSLSAATSRRTSAGPPPWSPTPSCLRPRKESRRPAMRRHSIGPSRSSTRATRRSAVPAIAPERTSAYATARRSAPRSTGWCR